MSDDLRFHVADHERFGCQCVDSSLGIQKMPDGYALMLDADETYFYWLRADGAESDVDWSKWRIRRAAQNNAKRAL